MYDEGGRRIVETTLDEPVRDTIMRDLREVRRRLGELPYQLFFQVSAKLKLVMLPRMSQAGVLDRLKEWDLWGPLAVCLTLSISLCISAPESQRALVFAAVFFIVWVGAAVVTLNAQLLGGKISFFQSVCVLGYSVFPLNVAAVLCLLLRPLSKSTVLQIAVVGAGFVWSTRVSVVFFSEIIVPERRALAIYPVFGFYAFIAWMIVIQ